MSVSKRRDKAVAGIPNFKEGEDVQDFMITAERKLTAGGVRRDEWIMIVASKLSEKLGSTWQDICSVTDDYQEAKERVLKVCGYTPKLAAEFFFGFKLNRARVCQQTSYTIRGRNYLEGW